MILYARRIGIHTTSPCQINLGLGLGLGLGLELAFAFGIVNLLCCCHFNSSRVGNSDFHCPEAS